METINFQIVENLQLTKKKVSEERLIEGLTGLKMKERVTVIRAAISRGDNAEADNLKKKLPAIIVSGMFEGKRSIEGLVTYTQVLCLDLDKIERDKLEDLKDKAIKSPYTFIAFVSPSGSGLKILVKVDSDQSMHKEAYSQILKYYSEVLDVKFDERTSDITRLTFMSYDPLPYHYPDSEVYKVVRPDTSHNMMVCRPVTDSSIYQKEYDKAFNYTNKVIQYAEGSRNNFLHLLANNCNRRGIPKGHFFDLIEWCDLPKDEARATVNSAYSHVEEFGKWSVPTPSLPSQNVVEIPDSGFENVVGATPVFPMEVFEQLPEFLKGFVDDCQDNRQRDMALTALLSILSGLITSTSTIYNGAKVYPCLGSMITAPSGSGKSVIVNVQRAFLDLHKIVAAKLPHGLFLPDNTTIAALHKRLAENGGRGIIFCTDLGYFGHMIKYDLDPTQALLRTSLSGEVISSGRNLKKTHSLITDSRLSLCLSSTPPEFHHLFTSKEDGLISRFIHYCFSPDNNWSDIRTGSLVTYDRNLNERKKAVEEFYKFVSSKTYEYTLLEEQQEAMQGWLRDLSETIVTQKGDNIRPIIRRMGQIVCKISMILATVRAWECNQNEGTLIATADDFDAAIKISMVYFEHASSIVNFVKDAPVSGVDKQIEAFFNALPLNFKRKEALATVKGIDLKVSDKTIDNWLKRLVVGGQLTNQYNCYSKVTDSRGQEATAA